MFTVIVICFCWWNLALNIFLKILDGLDWNFIYRLYLCNTLFQQNLDLTSFKKSYIIYFRPFLSLPSMFTFIVINFCWWNLMLNISLKILNGLGCNFIFRLYLCNTLFQQNLEKFEHHLKKGILYIFAPSCPSPRCLQSSSYAFADGISCSTYL